MVNAKQRLVDGPEDARAQIILAHGAGAPMDHPFMTEIAQGLAARGQRVIRFEFPYMARRRASGKKSPPDRPDVLQATWREVIESVADERPLVLAGKSMGGRVASLIVDESPACGLICLGYPFHPVGKPDKLRVDHLQSLTTPTLILQGSRDPFGNRDEVAQYSLSEVIEVGWLEDGDHSFKPRKASGWTLQQHLERASSVAAEWIDRCVEGLRP